MCLRRLTGCGIGIFDLPLWHSHIPGRHCGEPTDEGTQHISDKAHNAQKILNLESMFGCRLFFVLLSRSLNWFHEQSQC